MLIPKLIHFIWFPSRFTIPHKERLFIQQWKEMNEGYGIMIWDETSVTRLIYREYPEFMGVWKKLNNHGKKSDFARYIILHKYGGYYLDADQEPLQPLEHFMSRDVIYCKDVRGQFDPTYHMTEDAVDISSYDIIIGSDNFSARPSSNGMNVLTNCFIASIPGKKFWIDLVNDRARHYKKTVLTSFGTWAITDFVRATNPERLLELPSYYFNFIPSQMKCEPLPFTYSMHHSGMKWNDESKHWSKQT